MGREEIVCEELVRMGQTSTIGNIFESKLGIEGE